MVLVQKILNVQKRHLKGLITTSLSNTFEV